MTEELKLISKKFVKLIIDEDEPILVRKPSTQELMDFQERSKTAGELGQMPLVLEFYEMLGLPKERVLALDPESVTSIMNVLVPKKK